MKTASTSGSALPISLEAFAKVVVNLYRHETDDCVITLGDYSSHPRAEIEGQSFMELFV